MNKLNRRERILAGVVGVLLVGGGLLFSGMRAIAHMDSLNLDIDRLEQELVNLTQQNMQRQAIEAAYHAVVADHSSDMTMEEIHDNLRREIYRLAHVEVAATETEPAREWDMFKIPTLREGQLKDAGEGVREYQIHFRVPRANMTNLMHFAQRIEESGQILRVDMVELTRAPSSALIEANFVITRTVLDIPVDGREESSFDTSSNPSSVQGDG